MSKMDWRDKQPRFDRLLEHNNRIHTLCSAKEGIQKKLALNPNHHKRESWIKKLCHLGASIEVYKLKVDLINRGFLRTGR